MVWYRLPRESSGWTRQTAPWTIVISCVFIHGPWISRTFNWKQCCYFFKQAQFYKETGKKRALFQQKKWAKFKMFIKKQTLSPWVPHWASSLMGGYPNLAAQEGMNGARLSLLASSGERENMFNFLCFNFNLFSSWTYTNITKHSHHFELLVLVHMWMTKDKLILIAVLRRMLGLIYL